MSGIVEERAAGEVDEHAEALVRPPTHSPTIAPTTASVAPTRSPPRIDGSAAGISRVVRTCRRGRAERRGRARAGRDRPSGSRPSSRSRPGRRRSARRSRPCARRPVPNHRASSGARARIGIGLGRDEVGREEPLDQARAGEHVRRRRGRGADPTANPSDDLDERRPAWGAIVPSSHAPTKRGPRPSSGAGRMNASPVTTRRLPDHASRNATATASGRIDRRGRSGSGRRRTASAAPDGRRRPRAGQARRRWRGSRDVSAARGAARISAGARGRDAQRR